MSELIKLAKKYSDKPTSFNEVQFLEAFNNLTESEQVEAVRKGSELSHILVGWSAAVRIEMQQ